ncbi:uncharacterized protein DNG_07084 [Cephalotrichum gorgonifer]|uniref:SET domain-containing protein n=1 Tax=Cephalotrichum gorgonifer TaxID=2041049 RepID=A0AAE8N2N9_9PEZI|nr:uncharacterized protein DNG_07084 [Cephalotrichum gorgonifer]
MASSAGDPYVIREVPGKGKGLIATRKITRGTRILAEEPIIKAPRSKAAIIGRGFTDFDLTLVGKQVKALDKEKRRAFLALHNAWDHNVGIFVIASRINHDCEANSYGSWNELSRRYTVHAVRDIEGGEEITINYLEYALFARDIRRQVLQVWFAFDCHCRLCTLPSAENRKYESTLEEVRKIGKSASDQLAKAIVLAHITVIAQAGRPLTPGEPDQFSWALSRDLAPLLKDMRREVRFRSAHEADDGLPKIFEVAALLYLSTGDHARSKVMTQRAQSSWKIMEGDDGPNFLRTAAEALDPAREIKLPCLQEQKSTAGDIPKGLDEAAFEDWLWDRFGESTGSKKLVQALESTGPGNQDRIVNQEERQAGTGSLSNLRNRWTFPIFDGLPDGNKRSLNFYKLGGHGYMPQRHWAFLGEIIEITHRDGLKVRVRDVVGKCIPLSSMPGTKPDLSQVRKGYSIAILYAYQIHLPGFSNQRMSLNNPEYLKIIPTSLDNLLALNDRVQEFSDEANGMRKCHGCSKESKSCKK